MKYLGLTKIISGGQTGADQAGLRVAKALKISTGGWIPKGYKTEEGERPSLGLKYGLKETDTGDYPKRTWLNVQNSDGTLIFAEKESRGSILTQNVCRKLRKPYWINPTVDEIRMFVNEHDISVLNIAGNRESVCPGIGERVEGLLMRAIKDGS
jgi:hypothetical protein